MLLILTLCAAHPQYSLMQTSSRIIIIGFKSMSGCSGEALGLLDNTSSVAYISAERYSAIFITGMGSCTIHVAHVVRRLQRPLKPIILLTKTPRSFFS